MDHETATQMRASERYVIGDLAAEERDAFEEHFAGCARCLDEVWTASAFAANARAVFRDRADAAAEPTPARTRTGFWTFRWQFALPALAAMALASVAIYQNAVTIPGLRAPQAFMPAVVLDGATRASLPQVPAGAPLRFEMALGPGATGNQVWVELGGDSGRVLSSGWVKLPPPNEPLEVYFPIRPDAGRYSIVVRADAAAGASELARNRFEIIAQGASTR
ncbi:MAG TPA: zf-HC2 domain-containing protein [Bryobacteraceae bacterium]|nr:zf-HC2 domain-containing protein [Bryobacteraceae bacterium]